MRTKTPIILVGKQVKRGKHILIKITCTHCGLEHTLAEGLRVPPCGSHNPEYYVQIDSNTTKKDSTRNE